MFFFFSQCQSEDVFSTQPQIENIPFTLRKTEQKCNRHQLDENHRFHFTSFALSESIHEKPFTTMPYNTLEKLQQVDFSVHFSFTRVDRSTSTNNIQTNINFRPSLSPPSILNHQKCQYRRITVDSLIANIICHLVHNRHMVCNRSLNTSPANYISFECHCTNRTRCFLT